VVLSHRALDAFSNQPRDPAPFGSRALIIQKADTMKPPPWSTRLFIQDVPGAGATLRIEFRDHATYGVSHTWLNDHLLFLRVWWGRIVSSDFILDAASGAIVLAEDASYLGTILPAQNSDAGF
jgi:hypothetical protein